MELAATMRRAEGISRVCEMKETGKGNNEEPARAASWNAGIFEQKLQPWHETFNSSSLPNSNWNTFKLI